MEKIRRMSEKVRIFAPQTGQRKMTRTAYRKPLPNRPLSRHFSCTYFTGKERDEETGYSYFGARYMDHELMTMWLSVDPLSDKYPSISPYAYCAWNPTRLIDPDGQEAITNDDWYKNGRGEIIWDDNVCQPSDARKKNGEYIGDDHALLERFGFHQSNYSQAPESKRGFVFVNSTDNASASHYMRAEATMSVEISINSSIIGQGQRKFNGFNVKVQTASKTSGSPEGITYSDRISVLYGSNKLPELQQYAPPAAEFRDATRRNNSVSHSFFIPANTLNRNKSLDVSGNGYWMTESRTPFVLHPILPIPRRAKFHINCH